MNTGNITNTIIPFLLLVLCSNCDQKKGASSLKDPNHYKNQDSVLDLKTIKDIVNQKTLPFNPAFLTLKDKGGRPYVGLVYAIRGDSVVGPRQEVNFKLGKMPKRMPYHGILVLYLDHNGMELDSFNIPNPFFGRLETGYNKGRQRISKGLFEVPVPLNRNIAIVLMKDGTNTISLQDVSAILQDLDEEE